MTTSRFHANEITALALDVGSTGVR